ncbi:NDP-sugar synthase [Chloroflexota bacterium]
MYSTTNITKAMILAAGEGSRLRPLTSEIPKSLLPVGDKQIIVHQLKWLRYHGVSEVAINLCHFGEKIENELGDGSQFGVSIYYSYEEELLGTAGGVKKMEHLFNDTFIIIYGDIFTLLNLSEMAEVHRQKNAFITIALFNTLKPWEVGIVEIDNDSKLLSFTEKPSKGTEKSNLSNGGIYVVEPGIFNFIPEAIHYDFGYNVFPQLMAEEIPVYGYILRPDDYLIDIGTIENYRQVNEDIIMGKCKTNFEKSSH